MSSGQDVDIGEVTVAVKRVPRRRGPKSSAYVNHMMNLATVTGTVPPTGLERRCMAMRAEVGESCEELAYDPKVQPPPMMVGQPLLQVNLEAFTPNPYLYGYTGESCFVPVDAGTRERMAELRGEDGRLIDESKLNSPVLGRTHAEEICIVSHLFLWDQD
jgi:hypothetical protein